MGTLKSLTVQHKTKERYQQSLHDFFTFLKHESLVLPRQREHMDALVSDYLEHVWAQGEGRAMASTFMAALQDYDPKLKNNLPGSWRLMKTWSTHEVPSRAPPMTEAVLRAMVGWAVMHEHHTFALSLLVAFYGLLRTGELLAVATSEARDKSGSKKRAAKKKSKKNVAVQDPGETTDAREVFEAQHCFHGKALSSDPEQWAMPARGTPEVRSREVAPETLQVNGASSKSTPALDPDAKHLKGAEETDINMTMLQLFQEKKVPSGEALENLLAKRPDLKWIPSLEGADPNHRYEEQFKLHGPVFADGCPLQFGVTSGDPASAQRYGESRSFACSAVNTVPRRHPDIQLQQKGWCESSCLAWDCTICSTSIRDNVDMLRLLVESHSVSANLTSYLGEKPGASLLWNSSYFGALKCTRYLLEVRAAIDKTAPFQDRNSARNH
eukprot:s726_g31.t1